MSKWIVTTSDRPTDVMIEKAHYICRLLECTYVPRQADSLAKLRSRYLVDGVMLICKQGLVYDDGRRRYFFHINLAGLRIKNIINGKNDHMIQAMQLRPGQSVLDCTLGLASDAIVASFVAGASGHVAGIEWSKILYAMTGDGLKHMFVEDEDVRAAMRRIDAHQGDYHQILDQLSPGQFDVVYFDPMFRHGIKDSAGIEHLRVFANSEPITQTAVEMAKRVAAKRVVMKERSCSTEFGRLGFQHIIRGKYSSIAYGVIETGRECQ